MNPVEEFLEEFGEVKQADFADVAKSLGGRFGDALLLGAAAATVGAVVTGAGGMATALHTAATKTRDFKGMMDLNPDLHKFHAQDPKMFNQMYTSLRRANKQYSADPLIAGSYMRQMLDSPTHAGGLLENAIGRAPSTQGQFARDIARMGGEAAVGHMKQDFRGPLSAKKLTGPQAQLAADKEWIEQERAARTVGRMTRDPNYIGGSK